MVNRDNCTGCGACCNACPAECISMTENKEGFLHPLINQNNCIDCGRCDAVCPIEKQWGQLKEEGFTTANYLFINSSEYDRGLSSSGGFVKALGDLLLEEKGNAVFGAAFDENYNIKHIRVDRKDDLYNILGSKYVQSNTLLTFKEAERILENGYKVLFIGTPCQIEGINNFIDEKYKQNLYTISLFCHGVPSRNAWRQYLRDYWGDETIRYIQFRYKYTGWWNYGLRIQFLHDDYYSSCRSMSDPYLRMFLGNISLNGECYKCEYRKPYRISGDYYIGDAWNINRIRTNMDDNKGITSVLCYSKKGEELVLRLKERHTIFDLSEEEILRYRGDFAEKNEPENRAEFFRLLSEVGFKTAAESIENT